MLVNAGVDTRRSVAYYRGMVTVLGRPRSAAADMAVRHAVRRVVAAEGYSGVSIEVVAARSGVAKSTIYRRFSSKAEMVFDALIHGAKIPEPAVTGSFAGDVQLLVRRVFRSLGDPLSQQVVPGLLAEIRAEEALSEKFQAVFIGAERDLINDMVDRAVARGEFLRTPEVSHIHAQLLGTIFAWLFLLGDCPHDADQRLTDAIIAATDRYREPPAAEADRR